MRSYSSSTQPVSVENKNFYEWFSGVTDGEGNFIFRKSSEGNSYIFEFRIAVHIDDIRMLYFIRDTLKLGKVIIDKSRAICYYRISTLKEIQEIINIFNKYSLNSTKILNFINFKEAFELYINSKEKTPELAQNLEKIKSGMNSKRINFELPTWHQIKITPYWLLGFVEGEGSFLIHTEGLQLVFALGQADTDLALMESIKDFFNKLSSDIKGDKESLNNLINITFQKGQKAHYHNLCFIRIVNLVYIRNNLIPFFDSLVWQSKKEMDFQDWKTILSLKDKGLHYTDEGLKLIELIISQMNNRRLSNSGLPPVKDRASIYLEIKRLLMGPSNYEKKGDRIWIISQNKFLIEGIRKEVQIIDDQGNILKTFKSLTDCAKLLGVAKSTVSDRLKNNKEFKFENKVVRLFRASP